MALVVDVVVVVAMVMLTIVVGGSVGRRNI